MEYLEHMSDKIFKVFKPICNQCLEPLSLLYKHAVTSERLRYNIKIGKCMNLMCTAP